MEEKNTTPEYQLKATKKYLSKFSDMKIRVAPEWRNEVNEHAKSMGESTSTFIKRAINEAMERDKQH